MIKKESKILEVQRLIDILESGNFDSIIGTIESEILDFKKEPYQLNTTKQKLELAKDISAFANSGGGIIVIGVATCKEVGHPHELAEKIRPFERSLIDQKQYKDIINSHIYPSINIKIEWFPSSKETNKGLAYIKISETESRQRPFVIVKVLAEDEKELGNVVSFFQRKGDHTISLSAEAMHHTFKDGLNFDEHLREIKQDIKKLISQEHSRNLQKHVDNVLKKIPKKRPSNINFDIIDQRVNGATKVVRLEDDIEYILVAYPSNDIQIKGLFESRSSDIVKLINTPLSLRHAGFDISTGEQSKIIDGDLRRSVLESYKLLEVWKDGMILFVASGDEDFLCWGNYDSTNQLRINTIGLVESTYIFHEFVNKVYSTSNASNCLINTQLMLKNLPSEKNYVLPKFPINSIRHFIDHFQVEGSEIRAQACFDWKETLAEKAAYDLISNMYSKFGAEHEFVPYAKEINGEKVIDVQQIIDQN